jgi:hypothetical protein
MLPLTKKGPEFIGATNYFEHLAAKLQKPFGVGTSAENRFCLLVNFAPLTGTYQQIPKGNGNSTTAFSLPKS